MNLEYVENLIDRENIKLINTYLENTSGAYINYSKLNIIIYDKTKLISSQEEKQTLIEELGHYYYRSHL